MVGAGRSPCRYRPRFGASISPTGITDVTKIRSPHAIGDDHPCPGIVAFHLTFWVVLHVSGRLAPSPTPVEPGPRNCGHCSARTASPLATSARTTKLLREILTLGLREEEAANQ